LVFLVIRKVEYSASIVPHSQNIKFHFWGHDCVIFHNYEIRKRRGEFNILLNENTRNEFFDRLNVFVADAPFTIIAAAINKQRHIDRYVDPQNPYEIALGFCMERLQYWLRENNQDDRLTHVLVEKRGMPEDTKLELEFRRIADGKNRVGKMPNLDIRFMDKKHNSTGLQLADLVAYPIARHVIDPSQPNRAYELIEPKFRRGPRGKLEGYGLKIFPYKAKSLRVVPEARRRTSSPVPFHTNIG
jgi:hypothetical protein